MIAAILLIACLTLETVLDLCVFLAVVTGGTVLIISWLILLINAIVPGGVDAFAAHARRCVSSRPCRLSMGNAIARGWTRL